MQAVGNYENLPRNSSKINEEPALWVLNTEEVMALPVSYLRIDYFLPVFKPSSGFPLLPTVPVGPLPTPLRSVYIPPTQTHFNDTLQKKMQSIPKSIVWDYPFPFVFYEDREVKEPRYLKEIKHVENKTWE